jgi:aminoglycoside N3'-acetyltransferase
LNICPLEFLVAVKMKTDELPVVTKSKLERDVTKLGLASGRTVMLHASMKAIGLLLIIVGVV